MNNEQLSLELMGGNVALRNGLIMQWLPWIKKVVRLYSDGSEDSVNNAIAYVAKYLHRYDGSSGIYTWIRLGCVGGLRKADYKMQHPTVGGFSYLKALDYRSPRRLLMEKEYKEVRKEAINKAMSALSIPDQVLIKAYFFKCSTLEEIAEYEHCSLQAIHQRKARILRRMKRDITHYSEDLGRA